MNEQLIIHFETAEKQFLEAIKPHVVNYKTKVEITDVAAIQRKKFVEMADQFRPCFSQEVSLTSSTFAKKIIFTFTDGINLNGLHYNSLQFIIEPLEYDQYSRFNMQDFYAYKGIDKKIENFFEVVDYQQATIKVNSFIQQVVSFLEMEEIQSIVSTKKWIKVPKDMSGYK